MKFLSESNFLILAQWGVITKKVYVIPYITFQDPFSPKGGPFEQQNGSKGFKTPNIQEKEFIWILNIVISVSSYTLIRQYDWSVSNVLIFSSCLIASFKVFLKNPTKWDRTDEGSQAQLASVAQWLF